MAKGSYDLTYMTSFHFKRNVKLTLKQKKGKLF